MTRKKGLAIVTGLKPGLGQLPPGHMRESMMLAVIAKVIATHYRQ